MAKQSGIHQLKGKIRGMSYYRQKGVEDGLARSINQGLSKRVKEDAAYANTRLNAAEFGTAGSFAGAAIRVISDRQRTMLKDFATGYLAKVVKELITLDSTSPWGQRSLDGGDWQLKLMSVINTLAKNDFQSFVGGVWDVTAVAGDSNVTVTPNAELPQGWGSALAAKGATGAKIQIHILNTSVVPTGEGKNGGFSHSELIAEDDVAIGTAATFVTPATTKDSFYLDFATNQYPAILVVVLPYKDVNGVKYTMQELCTFAEFEVTEG